MLAQYLLAGSAADSVGIMNEYQRDRDAYETGHLHQRCSECEWWQSGHGLEVQSCPLCGAPINERLAIEFGGVFVEFDGTGFKVGSAGVTFGAPKVTIRIDRADYPDVITFMLRHAKEGPLRGSLGGSRPITSGVGNYDERNPRMAGLSFSQADRSARKCRSGT